MSSKSEKPEELTDNLAGYEASAKVLKSADFYVVTIKLSQRDDKGKLRPAPGSFTMDASFLWPVAQALKLAEVKLDQFVGEDEEAAAAELAEEVAAAGTETGDDE